MLLPGPKTIQGSNMLELSKNNIFTRARRAREKIIDAENIEILQKKS